MRPTMKYIESLSASARLDFERARVDFAEANAMMVGIMESVGDLTKIVAKFGDPDGVIPGELARLHELYRLRHIPKITSEALNVQGPLGWLVDYTGKIVRLPGDALLKEDVAFKLINYRMEVNARAARTAMKQGTNPADTLARYHLLKEHPSDVVTSQGIDVANYYTFTNSLGQKGKQLQGFARLGPMRWILPFVQTPTNLVKFGVRHSVFGNIYKDFKHITRLDATGDLARAQIAIGTMIPAALLMHFDENVTGAINTQTPAGRLAQTQGKPEYSIKIGDKWYSYGTIEPLRTVLGLLASYKTAVQHLDLEDKEHKEISKDLLAAAAAPFIKVATQNYLLPQLEGVFYMFQGLAKGDHAYALKFMQRLAASSTPAVGSQFISQINKTFNDPVWRQADNYIQMIMDKIPGLSTRLPAWHNIWGDEVGIPEGLGPDIVTPVRFREEPRDAVDKEMIRLFVDRPRRNDDTASLPHQRRVIDGIELTPQQRANFNIFVGKGLPGTAMVPLKNQIAREMSSPTFQNLPDVMKRRNIVSTINARRNQVERWMKGNDPDLKQKLEKARRLREIRERPTR